MRDLGHFWALGVWGLEFRVSEAVLGLGFGVLEL